MSAHGRSKALTDRSAKRVGCLMRAHGRFKALTPERGRSDGL